MRESRITLCHEAANVVYNVRRVLRLTTVFVLRSLFGPEVTRSIDLCLLPSSLCRTIAGSKRLYCFPFLRGVPRKFPPVPGAETGEPPLDGWSLDLHHPLNSENVFRFTGNHQRRGRKGKCLFCGKQKLIILAR